jgi:hypothetical protein
MDVVRSGWEESIESYIRAKYPALRIESNNRSVIPSRNTRRSHLEIDIFIPELCLGIEANGEAYHDRTRYRDDQAYGTVRSDEMYKEVYCKNVGIDLIQVWSSEDSKTIASRIDAAIQEKLADPMTRPWHQRSWSDGIVEALVSVVSFLVPASIVIGGGAMLFFLLDVWRQGLRESISDLPGMFIFFVAFVVGCSLAGLGSVLSKLQKIRAGQAKSAILRNEIILAVVLSAAVSAYAYNLHRMNGEDSLDDLSRIAQLSLRSGEGLGLRSDGTVVPVGSGFKSKYDVSEWTDITQVAAGNGHSVGLRSNGTVVAVGENDWDQCEVSEWTDIVQVAAGDRFTIGLRSDGSAVAVGKYTFGHPHVSDWTGIVQIAAGSYHAVGLRSDGTVVADIDGSPGAVENNGLGSEGDVHDWSSIVQISAGGSRTVGLRSDRTVVETGEATDASSWTDVYQVATGSGGTVGLLTNGTVVAVGVDTPLQTVAWSWHDIAQVASVRGGPVGLRSDGTVMVGEFAASRE